MLGLGALIGLPSIAYLVAFQKEYIQRESVNPNVTSLTHLARQVNSERDGAMLSKTASKLLQRLKEEPDSKSVSDAIASYQRLLKNFSETRSLSLKANGTEPIEKRFHSFSEFVSYCGSWYKQWVIGCYISTA